MAIWVKKIKTYVPEEGDFRFRRDGIETDRLNCEYCQSEIAPGQRFFLNVTDNSAYDTRECAYRLEKWRWRIRKRVLGVRPETVI